MKTSEHNERLIFLDELDDYKVASDDPDVRGWEMVDKNHQKLGKVNHLLADVKEKRVRYLDVDPYKDVLGKDHKAFQHSSGKGAHEYRDSEGDLHMIIPVGMARIDHDSHRVIADKIDRETFIEAPVLKGKEALGADGESKVREFYSKISDKAAQSKAGARTFKSEHHTKGNENMGSRDPAVSRDIEEENRLRSHETENLENLDSGATKTNEVRNETPASKSDNSKPMGGGAAIPEEDKKETRAELKKERNPDQMRDRSDKAHGESGTPHTGKALGRDPQVGEVEYNTQNQQQREEEKDKWKGENYDDDRFYNRNKS